MNIKTLFFVLAALYLQYGHSQIDLSFENWNTNAGYIQPNGWITSNWAVQCAFPDSNATDGYLASRIENNLIGFGGRGRCLVLGRFSNLTGLIDSITFDIRIDSVSLGGYASVGTHFFYNGNIVVNRVYNIDTTSNGYFKICLKTMNPNVNEIDSLRLGFSSEPATLLPNGHQAGYCSYKVDNIQFFYSTLSDDVNPKESNALRFFPNPATDKSIQVSSNVKRISISDMEGNGVYNELVNSRIIDLSSLSSGVYIITLEGDDQIVQERVIIK